MADDAPQELELDYANKKLKLRGNEIIQTVVAIIVVAMMAVFGYVLYDHKKAEIEQDKKYVVAVDKLTDATLRNGTTQREMLCVLTLDQPSRAAELSGASTICKRLASVP